MAWKNLVVLSIILIGIFSCEDVIEVETQPNPPTLVVNGLIRVDTTQEFIDVRIQVAETSDFFGSNTITSLDRAVILSGQIDSLANSGVTFSQTSVLEETEPGSGIYIPSFIPGSDTDDRIRTAAAFTGAVFLLTLEHKGSTYAAQTVYSSTVPIDTIVQGDETLFDEDDTEIKITLTDVPDEENYYVFDFGEGEFLALDDQFIDGQEFVFSYFPERDLTPGETLEVSILGADQELFNYIDLLVEQTENDGGVFETPAATVRGNIFDITGLDNVNIFDNTDRPNNFALGYFGVVQEFKQSITIEE
ncbi:MAG: DUF4249 family protein [Bacteroidota bacterium]